MKYNRGFGMLGILMVLVIIAAGGGGIYFYLKNHTSYDLLKKDNNQTDSSYIQTNNIRILYPTIGTKVQSGSTLEVKYEVLNDITENTDFSSDAQQVVILVSDKCGDSFQSRTKGVYTFSCSNIGISQTGPLTINIIEGARSAQEQPVIVSGQIQIVSSSNSKPLEIISDGSLEVYVPVGSQSDENVAGSSLDFQVKFSDGVTRNVPFTDFTYSFDDPTLVRFYPAGAKIPAFIGNRVGKTILHLQYQGIKKDISISTVPDATTPEDPSTYEKVYNMGPTSLNDFRVMCKQKSGKLVESESEITCTSKVGNYFISVNGR